MIHLVLITAKNLISQDPWGLRELHPSGLLAYPTPLTRKHTSMYNLYLLLSYSYFTKIKRSSATTEPLFNLNFKHC